MTRRFTAVRSRQTLVLFLKEPRLGRVKRRLAAAIGMGKALSFYRRSAARALALSRDKRWRTVVAVTPDRAAFGAALRALGCRARMIPQGRGDLGRRMARAFRRLAPAPTIIVGGDIPEMTASHIAAAFRALAANDVVFGPSSDGGYWLVGTRRARLAPIMFCGVRWSSAHALADTRANLGARIKVAEVQALDDVDDGESYRRFLERERAAALPLR